MADTKIFSNKSYRFDHPKEAGLSVTVKPGFNTIPDWAPDSTMYKLADADGDIMVINSREDEVAAETGGARKRNTNKTEPTV